MKEAHRTRLLLELSSLKEHGMKHLVDAMPHELREILIKVLKETKRPDDSK